MSHRLKFGGPLWVLIVGLLSLPVPVAAQSFKAEQLQYPRVRAARQRKEAMLQALFRQKGWAYPPREIFFRVFKRERVLEVWVKQPAGKYERLKEYPVCATSGELGPKRREGDGQIPEGFYFISGFNPVSNFHLSLKVNYPNAADRLLSDRRRPGGDIFIHGDCVTIGCVPLTDDKVEEVYWLAVEAKTAGQRRIPVHIFPARLHPAGLQKLRREFRDERLVNFWLNLQEGFDYFEQHRRLPTITVESAGRYRLAP